VCWDAKTDKITSLGAQIGQNYHPGFPWMPKTSKFTRKLPKKYSKISQTYRNLTGNKTNKYPQCRPNPPKLPQNYPDIIANIPKTRAKNYRKNTEKLVKKLPPGVILRAMPLGCVSAPYNFACHASGADMGHPADPSRGVFCILFNEFTHE
jgi:hypothetical protein